MTNTYTLYKITDLEPGHHLCWIYKTEEDHRAVLTPYLRQGLERGEKVLYIVDTHTAGTILEYLQDDGVEVEPYLASGQLNIVSTDDAYVRDGTCDPHRVIDILWNERGRALAAGYPALRITSEMTWILRGPTGSEGLIEYESKLNKFFPTKKGFGSCLAICQYDQRRFQPDLLLDVLTTHPIAIVGTKVYDNFYYLAPDDFSSPDRSAVVLRHRFQSLEERKRTEGQLQGDEEQFRSIYKESPIGIELYDPKGKLVTANKACLDIFGVSDVAEIEGFNLFNNLNMTNKVKERLGEGGTVRFETTFDFGRVNFLNLVETSKSGLIYLDVLVTELGRGEKGFKGGYLVYLQDISKRKLEEQMLQKSEDRFRSVIEVASDAIISCESSGNIISWNPRAEIMFEYSSDAMMGKPLTSVVPERFRKAFESRIKPLVSTQKSDIAGKATEVVGLRKDGSEFPVEVSLAKWTAGGGIFFTAVMRDITERKQTEDELRIKDGAITSSINAIALVDLKSNVTYVNPSFLRLWGYDNEIEVLGKPAILFWQSPAGATKVITAMPGKGWVGELLAKKKDGSTFDVQLSSSIVTDEAGKPICMTASFVDITEHKRTGSALNESQEKYRVLTESSADPIFVHGHDGRYLYANQACAKFFGKKPADIVGKNITDFFTEAEAKEMLKDIERVFRENDIIQAENTILFDKGTYYFSKMLAPIHNDKGDVVSVVGVAHDITERKQSEKKLQGLYQQEKKLRQELDLEIRKRVEFTRALVHELKTRLTPVLASSDLLVTELREEPWLSLASNVNRGASNLNNRIDELLDLARGEIGMLKLRPRQVSLLKLLRGVARDMVPVASNHRQSLLLELPPSLPMVCADEGRLRQVMLNLTSNACKFTPEGGTITVRAREEGGNMIVEVQDTSPGMTEEEQQRLFKPYHRIEADRECLSGLGLGLALSKTLVELHNGQIWVKSKKGEGNIFGLSIPLDGPGRGEKTLKQEGNYESESVDY